MADDPLAPTGSDALSLQRNQALERSTGAIDSAVGSMNEETALAQRKASEMAPYRERAMRQINQPMPQPPKLKEPPAPPQQAQGADEGWLLAVQVLGGLVGAATRRPLTNALAGMTGAIQGYQEGNREKFDRSLAVWDRENKAAIESNQKALNEYRDILENRKLNQEQTLMALQIAAMRHEDDAMAQAAKTKNSLVIAQLYDRQFESFSRMKTSADQLSKQHSDWREQQWETNAARFVASNPGIIDAILSGKRPPPSTNTRTGLQGAIDRALWSEIYARDPNFDASKFSRESAVKKNEALIPSRVEAAGKTAGARTAAVAGTNIELAMRSAAPVISMAGDAANAVPVTTFKDLNRLLQNLESRTGDPAIDNFKRVNTELANLMARALNPRSSQITNDARNQARDLIATADSKEQYFAGLQQFKQFIEREFTAVGEQIRGDPLAPIIVPVPGVSETLLQRLQSLGRSEIEMEKRAGTYVPLRGASPVTKSQAMGAGTGLPIPQLPEGWSVEQVQ